MDKANLKKITSAELRNAIAAHKQWLSDSKTGRRMDLTCYDLSGFTLDYVDLRHAILSKCDLSRSSLFETRLEDVLLVEANLTDACFRLANLSRACLNRATLVNTDFYGAVLRETVLIDVNIAGSNFESANISYAYFSRKDSNAQIARLDFGGWPVTVTAHNTTIGCQRHPNNHWLTWTSDSPEIAEMHNQAPAWWATYGDAVKAVINTIKNVVKHNKSTPGAEQQK